MKNIKTRLLTFLLTGVCIFMMTSCSSSTNRAITPSDLPTAAPTAVPTAQPPEKKDLFPLIYKEGLSTAGDDTLKLLDEYAADMKSYIINTPSNYKGAQSGTKYYFSENGLSSNDGLSPETPKNSLFDLEHNIQLKPGDVVLFERGSMFRGTITARTGVTYSAYGEGAKPIICGSTEDYAAAVYWKESDYENVYICTKKINNAGNIVFNNTWTLGDYDQILGNLRVLNLNGFKGPQDLDKDLDFYCDLETETLYLYSSEGNPGERFDSIEICENNDIFDVTNVKNIIIDNLHLTLGGAHGIGAVNANNLTVRNCIFNWIGGSVQYGTTRYGNAVESYVESHYFYVYNNWIYQIYDTGITTQFNAGEETVRSEMYDNEYYYNLIEYCFWSFEYFHRPTETSECVTDNIYVHDNFCRMGGEGWGRPSAGHMCCFAPSGETVENVKIERNIFDRGHAFLVSTYDADVSLIDYSENIYVQTEGELVARICNTNYYMDENVLETFTSLVGDERACVICVSDNKE